MSHQTAPTPYDRQPSPTLYGSITFTHLEKNEYGQIAMPTLKIKGKTCMVENPAHVKQLSLIHMCKIGLKGIKNSIHIGRAFLPLRLWLASGKLKCRHWKLLVLIDKNYLL
jgi:hypothetical protein